MSVVLENLFDEDIIYAGSTSIECYFDTQLIIAGARAKYPRSVLSIFNIVPRIVTKYNLDLVQSESITGAVFTTSYNIKRNLGLGDDPLTMSSIDSYFLDPNNDVLSLMIHNTQLSSLTSRRRRGRRVQNPVVFRHGSIPLLLIFESKKKIDIYRENISTITKDNEYTSVGNNVALINKYAGMSLLDVHTPSSSISLSAVYGFTDGQELRKLSNDKELEEYNKKSLDDPIRMKEFTNLFDSVKRNINLTNIPVITD